MSDLPRGVALRDHDLINPAFAWSFRRYWLPPAPSGAGGTDGGIFLKVDFYFYIYQQVIYLFVVCRGRQFFLVVYTGSTEPSGTQSPAYPAVFETVTNPALPVDVR